VLLPGEERDPVTRLLARPEGRASN
jgi:hypothetical protein